MKAKDVFSPNLKPTLLEGLAYLLWLVNILVCVGALIQISSIADALWVMFGGDRYSLSLLNQVCVLLGGLSAFIYVMILQGYYRDSVTQDRRQEGDHAAVRPPVFSSSSSAGWSTNYGVINLLRRFAITTAIPVGMFILSLTALQLAQSYFR
jgi:hypothetical protein